MDTLTAPPAGPPILKAKEARACQFVPMTLPYRPEREDWMLRRVLQDAERERCEVVLVRERAMRKLGDYIGLSVWRRSQR